jgi:hypothetical protein
MKKNYNVHITVYLVISLVLCGCKKNLPQHTEVYRTDFSQGKGDLLVFAGDQVDETIGTIAFNNTKILGPLNHNAVYKYIENLPTHKLIKITFDLYIHDEWKGNDGLASDFWGLFIDQQRVFYTTFSNLPDREQSYPEQEGYYFPSGSNSFRKDMPGLCSLKNEKYGSSVYQFIWIRPHTNNQISLALSDLVRETDICQKSWSIDNLVISCINFDD